MKTADSEYIKKNLLRSDLTPTQQMLFDFLDVDLYVNYCETFSDLTSVPVAKIDTLNRAIVGRKINENMNLYTSGSVSARKIAQMYKKTDVKKNLLRSDLTPTQQRLFDFLGMDKYVDFCEILGGLNISVTRLNTLKIAIARRKINENMDLYASGTIRVKQIAQMHDISERTAYYILSGR